MAGGTVLSDLPDDLLRHILYFALAKEGASTAVVSRRWRWLWASSGAVNLHWPADKQWRNPFRAPEAALGAVHAHGPVRRLTFHAGAELYRSKPYYGSAENVVVATLTNPAARHVEELRFTVNDPGCSGGHALDLGALPSEALRILHIARCQNVAVPPPAAAMAFTRLEACAMLLDYQLNRVINAAP